MGMRSSFRARPEAQFIGHGVEFQIAAELHHICEHAATQQKEDIILSRRSLQAGKGYGFNNFPGQQKIS
jgi:hypothetical protein